MSTVSSDPVADMLTRIRNAIAVQKHEVIVPHSKTKQAVAELLKNSGFIADVKVTDASIGKSLSLIVTDGQQVARITEIKRLSKPGRRQYAAAKEIPVVKGGRGLVIVSTSKGMMTGSQAKQQGIGGELICTVY